MRGSVRCAVAAILALSGCATEPTTEPEWTQPIIPGSIIVVEGAATFTVSAAVPYHFSSLRMRLVDVYGKDMYHAVLSSGYTHFLIIYANDVDNSGVGFTASQRRPDGTFSIVSSADDGSTLGGGDLVVGTTYRIQVAAGAAGLSDVMIGPLITVTVVP